MYSHAELDQLAQDWKLFPHLDLPYNPRIVVAGAFKGKLVRLFAEHYPAHESIVGFEPQLWAAEQAMKDTAHLERVSIRPIGLLAAKGASRMDMGEWETDACSPFAQGPDSRVHGTGIFMDARIELTILAPIDLLVINMEGYEYKLLPYILSSRLPSVIKRIAVQFHTKYAEEGATHTHILAAMSDAYGPPVQDDYPRWVMWRATWA